jgi:hypothetical protein
MNSMNSMNSIDSMDFPMIIDNIIIKGYLIMIRYILLWWDIYHYDEI